MADGESRGVMASDIGYIKAGVDDLKREMRETRFDVRERYTVSDELAILRQRDTKPTEFYEYNAFCEECKAKAKK